MTNAATAIPKLVRPLSLSARVIAELRELIVNDHFKLGQQLSETAIAELLGVSRTPVREAFLTLEKERLVRVHPQRGTFVFDYDCRELREICELRAVFETGALRIALERGATQLVDSLMEATEAGERAVRIGIEAYQGADTAFHDALVRASHNGELIEGYAHISGRIRAVRYRLTRTDTQIRNSQKEHTQVVSLLRAKKPAKAEAALVDHFYNGYRVYMDGCSEDEILKPLGDRVR